ncbi:hypothetical protein H0H93_012482 [Arthromyces matolae]|nr:hypothetical protein H0H93_012482 [Arthromyces matolae]
MVELVDTPAATTSSSSSKPPPPSPQATVSPRAQKKRTHTHPNAPTTTTSSTTTSPPTTKKKKKKRRIDIPPNYHWDSDSTDIAAPSPRIDVSRVRILVSKRPSQVTTKSKTYSFAVNVDPTTNAPRTVLVKAQPSYIMVEARRRWRIRRRLISSHRRHKSSSKCASRGQTLTLCLTKEQYTDVQERLQDSESALVKDERETNFSRADIAGEELHNCLHDGFNRGSGGHLDSPGADAGKAPSVYGRRPPVNDVRTRRRHSININLPNLLLLTILIEIARTNEYKMDVKVEPEVLETGREDGKWKNVDEGFSLQHPDPNLNLSSGSHTLGTYPVSSSHSPQALATPYININHPNLLLVTAHPQHHA